MVGCDVADEKDRNWFRKFYEFPQGFPIYETRMPQPQIVFVTQHFINPGLTRARSMWAPEQGRSVNVHAGEESVEFEEGHGVQTPARPKRPPKDGVEGLGAEDDPPKPRRRIVTSPTVQVDVTKPLPKGATPAQKVAYEKEIARRWEEKMAKEEAKGGAVRGWRVRALSNEMEEKIAGESYNTAHILSSLVRRIPTSQRAWLQSNMMAPGDPYSWLRTESGRKGIWTLWIRPECLGWLVTEGAKLGIFFGAPPSNNPNFPSQAQELKLDVQKYISGEFRCATRVARGLGVRSAAKILGADPLEPLSMSAMKLFIAYQTALRTSDDRSAVHEAYHRLLLARFLRRRSLVPQGTRASHVGSEAERRANLLQAHRVFVFNRSGCPVKLNKNFLDANGIEIGSLLTKNPMLVYMRNTQNQYIVDKWTRWLFEEVLRRDPVECRTVLTSESIDGLLALAGLGVLG